MTKINKKLIDSLEIKDSNYTIWDDEIPGFGVCIRPTGRKTYLLKYRNKYGRQRKPVIGRHGAITPEQARVIARQWIAEVTKGNDPSENKSQDRHSLTMNDFSDQFIKNYAEKKVKPGTLKCYKELVLNKIKPNLGQLKVNAIQRADIIKLHQKLSEKRPYVANRTLALLSKMFNMAEAWGVRVDHTNPCRHIERMGYVITCSSYKKRFCD